MEVVSMRRALLTVLFVALLGLVSKACEPTGGDYVIRFISSSLWVTDYMQSLPILHCTKADPCESNGIVLWEGNADLAGKDPSVFKAHIHTMNTFRDGAICVFETPARIAALVFIAYQAVTVYANNSILDRADIGTAYGIGWTWYF